MDDTELTVSTERFLLKYRQQIQDRLDKLGWTHSDLADKIGITKGRLFQVLADSDQITLRVMAAIDIALYDNEEEWRGEQ